MHQREPLFLSIIEQARNSIPNEDDDDDINDDTVYNGFLLKIFNYLKIFTLKNSLILLCYMAKLFLNLSSSLKSIHTNRRTG